MVHRLRNSGRSPALSVLLAFSLVAGLFASLLTNTGAAMADSPVQLEVGDATDTLEAALELFRASVVTEIAGDLNGDGRVSIGDLGILAASYGKTSAFAGWDAIKRADLNGDGIIDAADVAILIGKM